MLAAVDAALARLTTTTEETTMPKDLFDGFDPAAHEAEAAARWGTTPAHAEATRRTARYTDADWRVLKAEADAIMRAAADLADAGEPPGGSAAQAVVTRHRTHLDRWFYPCDPRMHAQLADLYEADPRFAATIDAYRAGLTGWLVAAIRVAHPEAQGA
jgi:hypothetical protein